MVLYDKSESGYNPKVAQAIYDSLEAHKQDLSLSESDLENKLIIVMKEDWVNEYCRLG